MFIDSSIPQDYKYIVTLNDNYIVLSNTRRLDMGAEYTVYIQFFSPSTEVIKLDNYRLTLGAADNIDWTYFYSYSNNIATLDSSELIYNRSCAILSDDYISSELFDRHVYIQFFSPSTEVVKLTNYRLTLDHADDIDWNYFCRTYNDITTLDSSELIYQRTCSTLDSDYISSELFDRHDYWSIGLTVSLFLCLFITIVNLATSLIHRGGIFHA